MLLAIGDELNRRQWTALAKFVDAGMVWDGGKDAMEGCWEGGKDTTADIGDGGGT